MCVDFADLNVACSKDLYPLPNLDPLIDKSPGYKTLSLIDSYSMYNQIKMDTIDVSKMMFMSNNGNSYYNIMPLGLRASTPTIRGSCTWCSQRK